VTARQLRVALRFAAAVPLAAATAAAVLKAGNLRVHADRYCIELTPHPRRSCPDCRGDGGWWVDGPHPEMEACGCWATRRGLRVPLLPRPAGWDEPPF
jgi:hypothetical protein